MEISCVLAMLEEIKAELNLIRKRQERDGSDINQIKTLITGISESSRGEGAEN